MSKTQVHKSSGQLLIEQIERYINRYIALPPDKPGQSLVLALWAVHTWIYEKFPATPYLIITAATKQAGKTLCMEVLSLICRGSHTMATLRPLALVRLMEAYEGRTTLFLDEAEKLNSAAIGDLRSIFTTGYTAGGKHLISSGTKEFVWFRTFAPKCFALIGSVMDVVRDRAIEIYLERANPEVDFRANRAEAEAEAQMIQSKIMAGVRVPALVQPMFLSGREREIWAVLFSVAEGLELDGPTMERLTMAASDLVGLKRSDARKYSSVVSEEDTAKQIDGERALRDLRSILKEGEDAIFSALAVERMKALPEGPWRTYKGEGLTVDTLASLVRPFGVRSGVVRMVTGKGASTAKKLNGYTAKNIKASVPSVERKREGGAE